MLVAEVWHYPNDRTDRERLATVYITNTGGTEARGEYRVSLGVVPVTRTSAAEEELHEGTVRDWPRLERNAAELLLAALRAALEEPHERP